MLGVAAARLLEPSISVVVGRWQVDRAYAELQVPADWVRSSAPAVKVVENGGVLLSVGYTTPDSIDVAISKFVLTSERQGWIPHGGSPSGDTLSLIRGDLLLAVTGVADGRSLRVELARYR